MGRTSPTHRGSLRHKLFVLRSPPSTRMKSPKPSRRPPRLVTALIETFGFSPWLASIVALFLLGLGAAAILWIVLSAPPRTITITSGPPGSTFERHAENYRKELATHGITLKILPSGGSLDNLQRLQAPGSC